MKTSRTADAPKDLVVVGASVRAIADSAARAGFIVHAADLFGDLDLRELAATVETVRPYPAGLPAAIAAFPPAPWIYTGALENHPELIAVMAAARPLAGCSPEAVARVRDTDNVAALVREAGLLFPETRREPRSVPTAGSWLVKPLASAGGRGIRRWQGGEPPATSTGLSLWQRLIPGRAFAAGYLLAAGNGQLITTSRQLIGRRWCHAGPFAYCGSVDIDPATLPRGVRDQLLRLGDILAMEFGLVGLVGVDLVIDGQNQLYVIEVNPRPTASVELVERATGLSLAVAHLAACGIVSAAPETRPRHETWSKAILFASRDLRFDDTALAALHTRARPWTATDGWPAVADIPRPPQAIPAGGPVCTVFAPGPTPAAALAMLRRRIAAVEAGLPS